MDTKISSLFWSKQEVEEASGEVKLAALWLLTNARMRLCGYAEVTKERFAFETRLEPEALERAMEALPETFETIGKGYWAPAYIKWQFGSGPALAKSYMSVPIADALRVCPEEVIGRVLARYPELTARFEEAKSKALGEGLQSPTQGVRARAGAGTRAGARARTGARAGDALAADPKPRKGKAGAVLPAEQPEPLRSRMLAVAALKHREPSTAWGANEVDAFRAQGLDRLSDADFTAQLAPLQAYYGAAIPRENDFRRRELLTLLNHWAGELDKAKAWGRDNSDGLTRL